MPETATAAALIRAGLCTALCLVAARHETVTCSCPCGGAYHALLATAQITLAPGHTRPGAAAALAGQLAFDLDTIA